ncbi:MAG TPA: hypothetical protein VF679_00785, partial [Pedobacter sp.]
LFLFLFVCPECEIMQIVWQCWVEDGSRPAAYAKQIGYANHPKVLCSKDMVLSVWAKGVVRHQVSVMKLNANELFT